jgi:S-adenosylmethionine-diacylglycerol 3-amino-3-carboxypropyl transferase
MASGGVTLEVPRPARAVAERGPAEPALGGRVRRVSLPDARPDRLFFAQVREDPELEIAFLRPHAAGRYVVVTSGGCTVLSLLASGAGRVVAVDVNRSQNDLLELKLQAIRCLPADAVVPFLGAAPFRGDRRDVYLGLRGALTPAARAYWDENGGAIRDGVLNAGVTERFVRLFVRLLRWGVLGRRTLRDLLRQTTLEGQEAFYRDRWDTRRWRLLVRLLLSRSSLGRTYDPAFFSQVGRVDFATNFRARIEHTLTSLPIAENYFLHQMLTGVYPSGVDRGLPPYLSPAGIERIRGGAWELDIVDGGYVGHLRASSPGAFDGYVASNICEWLEEPEIEELFAHVVRTASPGARLCFRNFVGWTEVPERWRTHVREDRGLGSALMRTDRSVVQRRFAPCRVFPTREAAARNAVRVREAVPGDDDALRMLAAACPMRGDVEICAEREPSFFALTRLEGEHVDVGVVDDEGGRPVGCIAVAERSCFLNGVPTRIAYCGDLKVLPSSRDRWRADALSQWAIERVGRRLGPNGTALVTVLAGNRAMERRLPGAPGLPAFTRVGTVRTFSVPLIARPSFGARGIAVHEASTGAFPEMSELWARVAPRRQFASALDADELASWTGRAPGLLPADYLLARDRRGELLGFLALWDQRSFKQLRVVRYSKRMRAFRSGFSLVAAALDARPLPPAGSLAHCLSVVHLCVPPDRPDVLRTLLARAYARAHEAGAHFCNVGLDRSDPLTSALRGLLAQPTDVNAYVTGAAARYTGPALDGRPLHFEIAMV